jgi:tRNA threonylcarbamoyladenosine biosynthesis protein TsaB
LDVELGTSRHSPYFAYTAAMRFIVVDTSDARGSVAIFEDARVMALAAHTTEEEYSSWLLPAAQEVLAAANVSLANLDGYAVCAGPGSFTGLRVGLTTVKAWAEIYAKPIASVSRLEALTDDLGSPLPISEPFIAGCFDARRDQVFAALYSREGQGYSLIGEEAVTSPSQFLLRVSSETSGQPVRWRTPDPRMIEAQPEWPALAKRGHVLETVAPPFAAQLGALAYRKFQNGSTTDPLSLDANYVRRSDAELFWKDHAAALKP